MLVLFSAGCQGKKAEAVAAIPDDNYRTYYEVFVYSFFDGDGDGDGIGDLQGLTQKLDYIGDGDTTTDTDLGCNGIWLMPIMPSPSYHKYDVTDYYAIDPQYGTMEDFEAFMVECKQRGIKVILDLVLNHTSSSHPWFQEACTYLANLDDGEPSAAECPYVDYYHFSKEKNSGYYQVPGSEVWYYEAQFYDGMPDLNLESEQVRKEIENIVDFWLKKGVGGFRLDAAKEYETGANLTNIEILTWFTQMVKSKSTDAYLVAEVWADQNIYAQYYDSGIDSLFDFSFANKDGLIANVVNGKTPASTYSSELEEIENIYGLHNINYIDAPFYTNHDMGRSAGYYAGDNSGSQTKLAGALNLLMSGSSFVYYGEELGMKGSGKDENKRAPMQFFEDKTTIGMCVGPQDMGTIKMKYGSLEEQEADPYSIYHYYKEAIGLRNTFPEISRGKVKNLSAYANEEIAAFSKTWEENTSYIFCNTSAEQQTIQLSKEDKKAFGKIRDALYVNEEQAQLSGNTLTIPAYGVVVLSK